MDTGNLAHTLLVTALTGEQGKGNSNGTAAYTYDVPADNQSCGVKLTAKNAAGTAVGSLCVFTGDNGTRHSMVGPATLTIEVRNNHLTVQASSSETMSIEFRPLTQPDTN